MQLLILSIILLGCSTFMDEPYNLINKQLTFKKLIKITRQDKHNKNYVKHWYNNEIINEIIKDPDFIETNDEKVDYCSSDYYSSVSNNLKSFDISLLDNKKKQEKFMQDKDYVPKIWNGITNKNILWFCKPANGSCSKGIIITGNPKKEKLNDNFVIQQNIVTNLLRNRKWDLRIFVIHRIINNNLETYVYYDGNLRLAPEIYDENNLNDRNLITNTSSYLSTDDVNKLNLCFTSHPMYQEFMNDIIIILKDVHDIMLKEKFIKHDLKCENHLFGYDFIFNKNKKGYILEVNSKPFSINKNNSKSIINMKKKMYKNIYQKFIKSVFKKTPIEDDKFIWIGTNKINY